MRSSQLEVPRERIIKGKENWWFVGPGGLARLRDHHLPADGGLSAPAEEPRWFVAPAGLPRRREHHLTADGGLSASAEEHLREQGLFSAAPHRTYALTVLTSTDCNLGCAYCFQNTGQDPVGGD